eukprot:3001321-Rhodomonas_salina.1
MEGPGLECRVRAARIQVWDLGSRIQKMGLSGLGSRTSGLRARVLSVVEDLAAGLSGLGSRARTRMVRRRVSGYSLGSTRSVTGLA